jgi:hypothetical protein
MDYACKKLRDYKINSADQPHIPTDLTTIISIYTRQALEILESLMK